MSGPRQALAPPTQGPNYRFFQAIVIGIGFTLFLAAMAYLSGVRAGIWAWPW